MYDTNRYRHDVRQALRRARPRFKKGIGSPFRALISRKSSHVTEFGNVAIMIFAVFKLFVQLIFYSLRRALKK